MIGITTLKCPECGDTIMSEEGKSITFCSSCGAKLMLSNENERVIRHVDESKIKSVENNTMLELKKLEIKQKNKMLKIKISLILCGIGALMMILGFAFSEEDKDGWGMLSVVGMFFLFSPVYIAVFSSVNNNDNDNS